MASVHESPNETLQDKFNRLSSSSSYSRIPILTDRKASSSIPQIGDSELGPNKRKTFIPRIISSPCAPDVNEYLASYSNKPSPVLSTPRANKLKNPNTSPSALTKLSKGLDLLSLSTPLNKRAPSHSLVSDVSPSKRQQRTHGTHVPSLKNKPSFINFNNEQTSGLPRSGKIRSISSPHLTNSSSSRLNRINTGFGSDNTTHKTPSRPPIERHPSGAPTRVPSIKRVVSLNPPPSESNPFLRLSRSRVSRNLINDQTTDRPSPSKPSNNRTFPKSGSLSTIASTPSSKSLKSTDSSTRMRAPSYSSSTSSSRANENPKPLLPSSKLNSNRSRPTSLYGAPVIGSTKSSRLKEELSTCEAPSSSLVIPKKRPLTKSVSSNNNLNWASNSPSLKRIPSTQSQSFTSSATSRITRSTSRSVLKPTRPQRLSMTEELYRSLSNNSKTSKSVTEWNKCDSTRSCETFTSNEVLSRLILNSFERAEVSKHTEIYYIGANTGNAHLLPIDSSQNFGYDDMNKNLKISINDHINYRYQVVANLGFGMFGNVLKCKDHKESKIVSLKIMKNDINWQLQSINEIKILRSLKGHPNILSYIDHFNFRSHICVVTELLAVNLIEALESTQLRGFELNVIKIWSKQLLSGLKFIHDNNIIHCDLKPENIMLVSPNSFDLKIIDFGSSAFNGELTYPYIQSRFYRAPEVLIGARYNSKIDIWSFGCLIYEMYKGVPLFPAKNELSLYKMIVKIINHPSPRAINSYRNEIIEKGSINSNKDPNFIDKRTILFTCFDRLGTYNGIPLEPFKREPLSRKLGLDDEKFVKFLQNILVWNQAERRGADKLLEHEFLMD